MKSMYTALLCGLIVAGSGIPAISGDARTKEELQQIIRNYLLDNPEILFEVQEAYQVKQQQELAENQRKTIVENGELIYNSPYQINFGKQDAPVTIVEFFDYNCGFCQRAMADMQRFLEADDNVRFVLKEYPVLGQQSLDATRVSLAFGKLMPEKHGEYHMALLSRDGLKDGEMAFEVAESFGVSRTDIEQTMESPELTQAIQDVYEVAESLGISGTPSYVVGEEVVFGAVGYSELKAAMKRQTN